MNQIKAGVVLNYVVLGLNSLVGLLYTPYMLRMLGQSEYGLYSLVASVIAYLTIMDLGFGNAVIRYTAKFRAEGKVKEQSEMFGMFLRLYLLIGFIAFIIGLCLFLNVSAMFGDTMSPDEQSKARVMMLILTINLSVTFPFSIYNSIITAYEDFVFQKSIHIIRILLNTAVMICLLTLGYKAISLVVVQTVFNFGTLLANYIYYKRKIGIKFVYARFNWVFLKEVSIYSFWIFLNAIMDRIYWSTGQFVLGITSGTVAISIFAVAIQLQSIYMSFSSSISGVLFPRITAMVANHNSEKTISDLFVRTGRIQYIILAFILSGFIVFGRQFVHFWAGDDYDLVYFITLIFYIPSLISLIQNTGIAILQARNQMRFRSMLYIFIAIISLALQVVLARQYGAIGCAIAIGGALILGQGLIMNIYYHRVQKIDILRFWKEIGKMSVVPTIFTIAGWWVIKDINMPSIFHLILYACIFSILYLPAFWNFSMSKYERDLVLTPIRKTKQMIK